MANAQTSISFSLTEAQPYKLTIYNITGQVVKAYRGQADAGTHAITWNGRDERGNPVGSGVYFYRLEQNDFVATRKMVLLK